MRIVQALKFEDAWNLCQIAINTYREKGAPALLKEAADRRLGQPTLFGRQVQLFLRKCHFSLIRESLRFQGKGSNIDFYGVKKNLIEKKEANKTFSPVFNTCQM